jgi:hypothetical protein
VKIAICTPYHGDVTPQYAQSLANMLLATVQCEFEFNGEPTVPKLKLFMHTSSILPVTRARLADDAIAWGANYLLWIDADQSFSEDALVRLLSLNKEIVGVNYARRTRPTFPTTLDPAGELVWTTEEKAASNQVEEVGFIGFGLCLISMPVIHALKMKYNPIFMFAKRPDGVIIGEDHYFCELARREGFPILIDHGVSWSVGHVSRVELYNKHTLEDRKTQ